MELRSVISLAACKRLVAVDLPEYGSNQHEINGVADLREFFSSGHSRHEPIEWRYFPESREVENGAGTVTFYDARARGASRTGRSEWRLYYSGDFLAKATPGDVLFLVRKASGELYGLVFEAGSSWLYAAQRLLNVQVIEASARSLGDESLGQELEFSKRQILEELGIDVEVPVAGTIAEIAEKELADARKDGRPFPQTRRMAHLAQEHADYDPSDPDGMLIALLSTEEQLFRAVESIVVGERLKKGFESVDEFVEYSLSVQNRRKSRMGYALQNHLAYIFEKNRIRFDAQATTEGKNQPDFLFPGKREYHDPRFDANKLLMLAAKSSCKERWRQILSEAARIPTKHLCTLEQAISEDQTREMNVQSVTLVIPEALHATYRDSQRSQLLTVSQFVELVRIRQAS